jgi:putative Holliday junction resolvase
MKYLGIDYGARRVGLAVGESETRVATPRTTLLNDNELHNKIRSLLHEEEIDEIVVGVPVSFDGGEHAQAREARAFGEGLKELGVPVHFVNEILSTRQSRASGAKDVDASAAALILQSFLDSSLT